jgi:chemotaxis signal transduction protein
LGDIYHPIDLAQRLSVIADLSGLEMRTVLYSNDHSQGAIRVEQVVGLTDVERKDCFPLPTQFRGDEQHWFMGMMLYQDHLVLILNPAWLLEELGVGVPAPVGRTEQIEATPATMGESC